MMRENFHAFTVYDIYRQTTVYLSGIPTIISLQITYSSIGVVVNQKLKHKDYLVLKQFGAIAVYIAHIVVHIICITFRLTVFRQLQNNTRRPAAVARLTNSNTYTFAFA